MTHEQFVNALFWGAAVALGLAYFTYQTIIKLARMRYMGRGPLGDCTVTYQWGYRPADTPDPQWGAVTDADGGEAWARDRIFHSDTTALLVRRQITAVYGRPETIPVI